MKLNKYEIKSMAVFFVCFFCCMLPCFFLMLSGTVTFSVKGFGVDSAGRLYVGNERDICIFESGTQIGTISPMTSRSYAFTVTEDDTILLSTSSELYTLGLDGEVLHKEADPGANMYTTLSYKKYTFTAANGDVYKLRNIVGWWTITKNNSSVVWDMGLLSFVVMLVQALCLLALVVYVFWLVAKHI